jgi:mRNA interferase MazF
VVGHPRRGEVYWVDFGNPQGSEQGYRRPALVIQNDLGNQASSVTIVAALTSQLPKKAYPFHVRVEPPLLPKEGVVLCEQLRTVALTRLEGPPMAMLPQSLMDEVDEALAHSLGLR